jgi:hypothetical protein
MTYYVRRNDTFWPHTDAGLNVHTNLPAENFVVREDEFKRLYLVDSAPFHVPGRVYGNLCTQRDRIISTFLSRPTTTGVLLAGEKGSGKTLLSKSISTKLAEQGVPTIIVNQPFCGDSFNLFIQTIDQPAVVLFDEFEKVYKREEQEALLTLLDGVVNTKKLFILTCNDAHGININMRNRPGRIYYFIPFVGLAKEFIREYCEDVLDQKEHIDRICALSDLYSEFNFDMLKALVEEMNRYREHPENALAMLNAKPEACAGGQYTIRLVYRGREVPTDELSEQMYVGNPFGRSGIAIEFRSSGSAEKSYVSLYFTDNNFERYDATTETFVFQQDGAVMFLTKITKKDINYLAV